MKTYNFLIFTVLILTPIYSHAFKCKPGQRLVSSINTNKVLSEEEIEGGYEYLDVVSHLEGQIEGNKYTLNKSMELFKHLGKSKKKILKIESHISGDGTEVTVFKHDKYHFFDIGQNDWMQGYSSSIYIVDLENKEVISKFHKCGNSKEFLGLKNNVLTYMCEWYCKKDEYFVFSPKEKKFINIKKKHDCNKLALLNKPAGLKSSHFKYRYKKDKNGIEYKSSRQPFNKENCK